ncbi:TetR family transcriptional regulator [Nocardia sp. NPDC051570]|uniref:TetR family transcriptional regulator n=1 Tax=Nocardia sp. NPDC051570 TaxID=3364324 RepID=UPI0037B5B55B
MSRWEPNSRGRLERAALELYRERGFDRTTVAEIAERAGLTERTFFRHFTDKREVLFGGQQLLHRILVDTVAGAPDSVAPFDAVAAAVVAVATEMENGREYARQRREVIAANPSLRERELIKLAALSSAMAEALRTRGVPDPAASLTAEAGIAVFKIAFERWQDGPRELTFADHIRDGLEQLRTIAAGA